MQSEKGGQQNPKRFEFRDINVFDKSLQEFCTQYRMCACLVFFDGSVCMNPCIYIYTVSIYICISLYTYRFLFLVRVVLPVLLLNLSVCIYIYI